MNKFDQGWRELNPVEKVETAMDFLLTFAGMILIAALCAVGGVLLYNHLNYKIEHYSKAEVPCGTVGPLTIYCNK